MNDNKSAYLTFINVVSAFSVLILHTNGCFWQFSASQRYWKTANVIECVFYFAVPLFFMVSGITLMDFFDRYSLRFFFKKRIRKTFIPFLSWSLIGLLEKILTHQVKISDISLKYIYQGITGTSIVGIYWFFTSLFIIYLCMPLFAAVEKEKRKEIFSYLVIVGIFLNVLIPFIKAVFSLDLNTPYNVPVISGVLIWPIVGWLLHNFTLNKYKKLFIYLLSFGGLLVHIIGTYILSMRSGSIVQTFKGYQNVPCFLYSIGVFVFFKDIGNKIMKCRISSIIEFLGQYTFSIYLMQFIFLDIVPRFPFINTKSIAYRLGAPFIFIPLIILITNVLRKIPGLKQIVPK